MAFKTTLKILALLAMTLVVMLSFNVNCFAQGSICADALLLPQTISYCSDPAQYSNNNVNKTGWFQFVATASDLNISVSGTGQNGTLADPLIKVYSDCKGTQQVGKVASDQNSTGYYKGGLVSGSTYYLAVSSISGSTGTFKVCLNNYFPAVAPGQDCNTAAFLCSTQPIIQKHVSGAGLNNNEAAGTCLEAFGQASESNSTWYKWQAANTGTLVFTITPDDTNDDIDWVLFDLGVSGDCSNVKAVNAIRCKAGYGVSNVDCPGDVIYYKSGLDFNEVDLSEPPNCGRVKTGN